MNTNVLSRSDRESVAILTFERPAKLNALNYELVDSIVQALDEIEVEDQIRAVVLTGSGRAFSAGADIHEFSEDVKRGAQIVHRKFVRRHGRTQETSRSITCADCGSSIAEPVRMPG